MSRISDRLKQIEANIADACVRAHRDVGEVKMVVVTKTAPLASVKEVIELGYTELGGNRVGHMKQLAGEVAELVEQQDGESGACRESQLAHDRSFAAEQGEAGFEDFVDDTFGGHASSCRRNQQCGGQAGNEAGYISTGELFG